MVQQQQETTKTGATYERHIKNYAAFWSALQDDYCAQDPLWTRVPAFPITAANAALFVEFEMQRPKLIKSKKGARAGELEYQEGTTIGVESIKQAISALEGHRRNHAWEYPPGHETHIKLRDDIRIQTLEDNAGRNESQRVDKAQKLKASGTSSDTYAKEELILMSKNALCNATTPTQLVIGIRDRTMLLVATQMAFRGDNLRQIQLSDLFATSVPNPHAGEDRYFEVMGILADQGKTNQHSRVDELGALRHKRPELCAVGAVALHLFVQWHPELGNEPLPSFAPEFSQDSRTEGFGEYGKRDWYGLYAFHPEGKSAREPMKYSNHYQRVKKMHQDANVSISKATHAARSKAAQTAREHGASMNDTKALGLWNESGSYRNCYDRLFPMPAMLGAAHHLALQPEAFFVARAALDVPEELLALIFPWVEAEEAALQARYRENPANQDIAAKQLFRLLKWFRRVLAQDLAVLYSREPRWQSLVFDVKPFNLPIFDTFARGVASRLADIERTARLRLDQFPERIASGFRSAIQDFALQQRAEQAANRQLLEFMRQEMLVMASIIQELKQREPPARAPTHPSAPVPLSAMSYRAMLAAQQGSLASARGGFVSLLEPGTASGPHLLDESAHLGHWPNARLESPPTAHAVYQDVEATLHPAQWSAAHPSAHVALQPARPPSLAMPSSPTHISLPPPIPLSATPSPPLSHYPGAGASPLAAVPLVDGLTQPDSRGAPHAALPMPGFTSSNADRAALVHSWHEICARHAMQLPQIAAGEWRPSKNGRSWVPVYKFSSNTGLLDLWKEWTEGCDGKLSVEALDTGWEHEWRAEPAARTAYCRRSRVIALLRQIMCLQRAWGIHLVIRFLHAKSKGYQKHTTLYNALTSTSGTEARLLAEASTHRFSS